MIEKQTTILTTAPAIRDAIKLALQIEGFTEQTISEVFNEMPDAKCEVFNEMPDAEPS
jgi:hypothetical protein